MSSSTGQHAAEYAEILEFAYGLAEQVSHRHSCKGIREVAEQKTGDQDHPGGLCSKMG